jgi:hypothetical protein
VWGRPWGLCGRSASGVTWGWCRRAAGPGLLTPRAVRRLRSSGGAGAWGPQGGGDEEGPRASRPRLLPAPSRRSARPRGCSCRRWGAPPAPRPPAAATPAAARAAPPAARPPARATRGRRAWRATSSCRGRRRRRRRRAAAGRLRRSPRGGWRASRGSCGPGVRWLSRGGVHNWELGGLEVHWGRFNCARFAWVGAAFLCAFRPQRQSAGRLRVAARHACTPAVHCYQHRKKPALQGFACF